MFSQDNLTTEQIKRLEDIADRDQLSLEDVFTKVIDAGLKAIGEFSISLSIDDLDKLPKYTPEIPLDEESLT